MVENVLLAFYHVFPLDIVRHIQKFVNVWRVVDAQLVRRQNGIETYRVELRERVIEEG